MANEIITKQVPTLTDTPGVTLDTSENPFEGVVLQPSYPPFDEDIIQDRTNRYAYAEDVEFDEVKKLDIQDQLMRGNEDRLRNRASMQEQYFASRQKNELIREVILGRPGEVTPEEIDTIMNLDTARPTNPQVIYEAMNARKKTAEMATLPSPEPTPVDPETNATYPFTLYDEAAKVNQPKADEQLNIFESFVAQDQVNKKLMDEQAQKLRNNGYFKLVGDIAVDMAVPFWSWWHAASKGDSLWLGEVYDKKIQELKSIKDLGEFEAATRAYLDQLPSPLERLTFLNGMNHLSNSDKFWLNFRTVDDFVVAGTMGIGALWKTGNMLAAGAISLTARSPKYAQTLDKMGLITEATRLRHQNLISVKLGESGQKADDVFDAAPSLFNMNAVLQGADAYLSNEQVKRLGIFFSTNAGRLLKMAGDTLPVDRLQRSSDALTKAYEATLAEFKQIYTRANDSILNVSAINKDDTMNLDALRLELGQRKGTTVTVKGSKKKGQKTQPIAIQMGSTTADLFDDAVKAEAYAKRDLGLADFTIEPRGGKFFIQVIRHVDETAPSVQDALAIGTNSKTPRTKWGYYLDMIRNPDSLVSKDFVKEFKSIYGLTQAISTLQYATRSVRELRGGGGAISQAVKKFVMGDMEHQRLTKFMARERDAPDIVKGGRGKYSRNVGEFAAEWVHQFGKLPNERETRAYWAMRQVNDIDYANYNTAVWTAKMRKGMMEFAIPFKRNLDGLNQTDEVLHVEGRRVQELPWSLKEKDPDVGIVEYNPESGSVKRWNFKYEAKKTELEALIKKEGYSIIHVDEFGAKTLRDTAEVGDLIPKGNITYVLLKKPKERNLPFQQVPYQAGGHVEYAHGWFIKQPTIVKHGDKSSMYYGDVNIRGGYVQKDAVRDAKSYDVGRKLLREEQQLIEELKAARKKPKNIAEANRISLKVKAKHDELNDHLRRNLVEDYNEFKRYFVGNAARLDLDTPIYAVRKDTKTTTEAVDEFGNKGLRNFKDSLGKAKYPNWMEKQDSPFNLLADVDLRFGMEKNEPLYRIAHKGTAQNPLNKLEPARLIDPYVALDSSARYLMRGRYLNDIKYKASEQFVSEFGHLFPDVSIDEMRRNPMKWLYSDIPAGAGPDYRAGVAFQRTAREFLKIKDVGDRQMLWFRTAMLEKAMNFNENLGVAVEPYLLHKIKDPVHYMRSFAFHMKILSPHQLTLQASTVFHASSFVGPKKGIEGVMISAYLRAARFTDDPVVLNKIAGMAQEMWGMKPEHFLEMRNSMERSGIMEVGREVGMFGEYFDPQVVQTSVGSVLDAGRWFFNEGERISRSSAWAMAYREWRGKNPTMKFTDDHAKMIRKRADLMTGNMTSQNNAMWQKGVWGVPTQFWGYPIRIAEQFMGKRLTGEERRRMFLTYGAIYGWPNTINLAMPFWPASESIRAALLDQNIDTDTNTVTRILMDGLGSYVADHLLDDGDTQYNFGQRYGLGLPILRDLVFGDKNIFEAFGGASGTIMSSMLGNMMPILWRYATLGQMGTPVTPEQVVDVLGEQSTFSNATKWIMAAKYGALFTKQGNEVGPMTGKDGFVLFMTGLMPQHLTDAFILKHNEKLREQANAEVMREAEKWLRLSIDPDLSQGDKDKYIEKVEVLLEGSDLTPSQRSDFVQNVLQDNYSMLEKMFRKSVKQGTDDDQSEIIRRRLEEPQNGDR
jgi:hypothetical protein